MIYRMLDLTILLFVVLFFVGILAFDYYLIGVNQPVIPLSSDWKVFFDFLIYPLVCLLVVDIVLKYRKEDSFRTFVQKYWIDIVMLVLIPIFSVFKILKVGLGVVKKLKTAKMGAKAAHKTKKVIKK